MEVCLLEELSRKNSASPSWHQCQHGGCGLLCHEDLETWLILARFVRTRRRTKLAANFVETDTLTRLHKTCSKFCEENFPRNDWLIQKLLQVLFLRASFVSRKDLQYTVTGISRLRVTFDGTLSDDLCLKLKYLVPAI
jgi:hypothetical protein